MKKLSESSDPSLLQDQLLSALPQTLGVNAGEKADPWHFRIPLRLILGEAWRCAGRSDYATLHALLRVLVKAQDLVRPDLPDQGPPEVEAAREVHYAAWILHIAESFLRTTETKARLRDQGRSGSERKVLRVLFENRSKYMRRKEIEQEIERLLPPPRPTPPRISQILAALWEERLLTRRQGTAQGNPQTSFFALSALGLEVCKELGLTDPQPLFQPDAEQWRHLLRRAELAANQDRYEGRERIAAFYRPRAGAGCSRILARCASALAEDLGGKRVLILDLEGEDSSLPDYLGIASLERFQGLFGLLEDYRAQPEDEQCRWLESSLFDERYACRVQGQKELFYLPAFQYKLDSDLSATYSSLLQSLRSEIEIQPRRGGGAPQPATAGFLRDLREVLRDGRACAKTLIQAPCGLGPGAYLACVLLAEELVLFLRTDDDQRKGVCKVLRQVVGTSLLCREAERQVGLAPVFVFTSPAVEAGFDPTSTIDNILGSSVEEDQRAGDLPYRIALLPKDEPHMQGVTLFDLPMSIGVPEMGYRYLVDILHPDSAWIQHKRNIQEIEARRGRIIREIQGAQSTRLRPSSTSTGAGSSYSSDMSSPSTSSTVIPMCYEKNNVSDAIDAAFKAGRQAEELSASLVSR